MQHSLRSPGSRIDFLYPNSRPHSGHFQRLHPATNAGSAWWAIQVLSRTGVSRGKQGLAMMGAGADLVSVKTTRLSGTDVTFITTSPNCLLCQIVWARPLPRIFSFVLSPSNLCFRREISVPSPPVHTGGRWRAKTYSSVCWLGITGIPRLLRLWSAASHRLERYLTQDPSRKRRRWRQALAPAAFGGCTTGQAPRRCCRDRSKTSRRLDILMLCTEHRGAMQWPPIWPPPLI